jgi:hypothetical protein
MAQGSRTVNIQQERLLCRYEGVGGHFGHKFAKGETTTASSTFKAIVAAGKVEVRATVAIRLITIYCVGVRP